MSRARRRTLHGALLAGAVAIAAAPPAFAQSADALAERVARAGDGTVVLRYAARPDVCGDGAGTIGYGDGRDRTIRWSGGDASDWRAARAACVAGPARVALTVVRGRVSRARVAVAGPPARADAQVTDLGVVSAPAAAAYLLTLAERADARVGREAVFAATLADSAVVWPRLLRLARDAERPRATRDEATLWLADAAGTAVAPRADDDARTDDEDVREQAVFALSQRPREESVPALIRVARTNRDARVRRKALFWLGQSKDPRALDLFEAVLARR